MSDGALDEGTLPVSSLRSKFEKLAAASSGSFGGSTRSRAGAPGSQLPLPGRVEEGHPRVRARSTPATDNGVNGVSCAGPSSPGRTMEVRSSPSSPDLNTSYRRDAFVSNPASPTDGVLPPLPRRPSRPALEVQQARASQAIAAPVPSVVVNIAPALSRKPPPPPPPLQRQRSREPLVSQESKDAARDAEEKARYVGLAPRSPSDRLHSPVTRSTSAPTFLSPLLVQNGFNEVNITDDAPYTTSPPPELASSPAPPLPARPYERVTEDGRYQATPSAPSSVRHRPTVSTGGIREIPPRPPPIVPPRLVQPRAPPLDTHVADLPPPLPIRPRLPSPTGSDDPSYVYAPPLPVRKPVPHLLAPSPSAPLPVPKIPRLAPPAHRLASFERSLPLPAADSPPVTSSFSHPPPPTRIVGATERASPMSVADTPPVTSSFSHPPPPMRMVGSVERGPPLPVTDTSPLTSSFSHPPPPTRTVGPGFKPPALKRTGTEDSSGESDDEEEGEPSNIVIPVPSPTSGAGLKRGVDDLPDTTHSNRRPPCMFRDHRSILAPFHGAHYGVVAVSGNHVCMGAHAVRVYDMDAGTEHTVQHVDLDDIGLEWRIKDPRITAMEFKSGAIPEEEGRFLWCGTKDGHLWELDIWTGLVTDKRSGAHSSAVCHIFRYGRSMFTIEEAGKMYVFDSEPEAGQAAPRMSQTPRLVRIADKQMFARPLGLEGQVWTSDGTGGGIGTKQGSRGPTIRIYDTRSAAVPIKSVIAPDGLGAVTAACILPSHPDHVYVGHEGGSISIWSRNEDEPVFVKTVKIGPSDILALEGVMGRLWIGNRQGVIAAYDVNVWPWKVTNMWRAHDDSPVSRIIVDAQGIVKSQRLLVISTGKDERIRFWDGLLGTHWINDELLKREEQFSTFRTINVLLCTWNVDAAKPEALIGSPENATFFEDCLHSVESPDIIVFSFQEIIDLENRKLTAKTVLLGGSKRADGSISEKVSRHYKLWYDRLVSAVRIAMPPEQPYTVILNENLVGLFTCIFVRASEKNSFKDLSITTVKRGMGGMYGNKGAIVARFTMDDSSLCFINCHLSAGQHHVRERNTDLAVVLEEKSLFPESADDENLAFDGGGDGTMVLDHEICFLNGDLNYRIEQRRDAVIANIRSGEHSNLLPYDQLYKEMKTNPGFRLRGFSEAPITFKPTYKYDPKSDEYDTSGKKRTPAWCDRILYRTRDPSRVQVLQYRRYEANISDHRPVSGAFRVVVKSLTREARLAVKQQLEEDWKAEQHRHLEHALAFYRSQGQLTPS